VRAHSNYTLSKAAGLQYHSKVPTGVVQHLQAGQWVNACICACTLCDCHGSITTSSAHAKLEHIGRQSTTVVLTRFTHTKVYHSTLLHATCTDLYCLMTCIHSSHEAKLQCTSITLNGAMQTVTCRAHHSCLTPVVLSQRDVLVCVARSSCSASYRRLLCNTEALVLVSVSALTILLRNLIVA
jgi:hypothetical protein